MKKFKLKTKKKSIFTCVATVQTKSVPARLPTGGGQLAMAAPLPSEMPPKLFRLVALLFAKLLLLVPREVLDQVIGGICPIGFQLGGGCALGSAAQCPVSLPRYECLNGVCCRDLRPLPQRLQPPVYPTTNGFCVDSAANCILYTRYCRLGCYRRCMRRHCPATCGFCSAGGSVGTGGQLTPINGVGLGVNGAAG